MLRKLTHTFSYNLMSLLAVLFIAVGMSIFHPAFHTHLEHHHIVEHYEDELSLTDLDADKGHPCPICHFQARNQFFNGPPALIVSAGEPFKTSLPPMVFFLEVKAFSNQAEPRASPYFKPFC